jgi:hypothetical protein
MWKEPVVTYLDVVPQHFLEGIVENKENIMLGLSISRSTLQAKYKSDVLTTIL